MLRRKILREMHTSLYLPVGLCILSLILAQNFQFIGSDRGNDESAKMSSHEYAGKSFSSYSKYMLIMSFVAYSQVTAASKLYPFK